MPTTAGPFPPVALRCAAMTCGPSSRARCLSGRVPSRRRRHEHPRRLMDGSARCDDSALRLRRLRRRARLCELVQIASAACGGVRGSARESASSVVSLYGVRPRRRPSGNGDRAALLVNTCRATLAVTESLAHRSDNETFSVSATCGSSSMSAAPRFAWSRDSHQALGSAAVQPRASAALRARRCRASNHDAPIWVFTMRRSGFWVFTIGRHPQAGHPQSSLLRPSLRAGYPRVGEIEGSRRGGLPATFRAHALERGG